jgi:hypothetical protein
VVLVILVLAGFHPPVYLVYAFGQLALVSVALIPNFRRLAAGTEKPVSY